jgi:thioester reductase-like protein
VPTNIEFAPEAPIQDARTAVQTGYSESKWVAERFVQLSSEKRYLNANVIRVGLLTGSSSGFWDTAHWVPALVQSGAYIGCIPDGEAVSTSPPFSGLTVIFSKVVSWIPINDAAAAIVDMRECMNETLHMVHPRPTTWRAVMDPLAALLGVPLVPYKEWFARLKATAEFASDAPEAIPAALKLLDFFQHGLKPVSNRESMGLLPKVVSQKGARAWRRPYVQPLGAAEAKLWIRYWHQVGFIPRFIPVSTA